ncbi:hypothetical protein [Apilactobacillus quenuiae]|uniref:hypothetical protein n=1 Tax=Apilactobacillus quenuiae TaxID=2008377 RepID=UPI000D018341|nr:hypothetical protein [Apilactobacillus quenuiae]
MLDNVISKVKNMMNKDEDSEQTDVDKDAVKAVRQNRAMTQYRHLQGHNELRYGERMHDDVYSELNKNRRYGIMINRNRPKSIKQIISSHNN